MWSWASLCPSRPGFLSNKSPPLGLHGQGRTHLWGPLDLFRINQEAIYSSLTSGPPKPVSAITFQISRHTLRFLFNRFMMVQFFSSSPSGPLLSSIQFSRSVVSDSLRPQGLQHSRPPCPSPTPEFTQTHVHRVSDAIQSSHPLSFPSLSAPNPSQHQGLFQ